MDNDAAREPIYSLRVAPARHEIVLLVVGTALMGAYFWLLDDAFIYFRYLDNLLFLRVGLVFNAGEYVEGYSSPLWLLLMLPLRAAEMPYPSIVSLYGAMAWAGTWYGLVVLRRWLTPEGPVINFPLCFLAVSYPFLTYFTSGVESPLVNVLAVVYALAFVAPHHRGLQCLAALAPLARPELLPAMLLLLIWSWYRLGRCPWTLYLAAALANGGWMLFRIWYYADLFPNTYYLKNLWDPAQGIVYLVNAIQPYHLGAISVALLLVSLLLGRRGGLTRVDARAMMVCAAVPGALYVIKIGGDARHFRYLAFPIVLMLCASSGVLEAAMSRWLPRFAPRAALAVVVATVAFSASCYPPQLSAHPFFRDATHLTTSDKIADAYGHRWQRRYFYGTWKKTVVPEFERIYLSESGGDFHYTDTIAEGGCAEAYEAFNVRVVHELGLTDPFLARTIMAADRPAHKQGLIPLAKDLVKLEKDAGTPSIGMCRAAVELGEAPFWIEYNLDQMELIERKAYNQHHFFENLVLAFTPTAPIEP